MKKLFFCFVLILLCGCSPKEELYTAQYLDVFDTYSTFESYAQSKEEFDSLSDGLHKRLVELNKEFDIYNNYEGINNIKTINDNAGKNPVKVNSEIIELIKEGKEAYISTEGKINIAMGSVLSVWHNYRQTALDNPQKASVPPMAQLEEAKNHCDINKIIIDEKNSTVYISDSKISLDVGALAKGFAADKAKEYLKTQNVDSALLNLGGNVVGINGKIKKSWTIGVQSPDESSSYIKTIEISNESAVSSGNYQRYYEYNGKRYHHIIDPDTLFPAQNNKGVTVVTESSAKGDMLSTYLFIQPYEKGKNIVKNEKGHFLWITSQNKVYEQ